VEPGKSNWFDHKWKITGYSMENTIRYSGYRSIKNRQELAGSKSEEFLNKPNAG
jgi:hypothetical protein